MRTMLDQLDYDALVRPIETARTPAEARSAVWAVLRDVKYSLGPDQHSRNIIAAIDAAAWQAGLLFSFRANAIRTAITTGFHVCRGASECNCLDGGLESFFPILPATITTRVGGFDLNGTAPEVTYA